MIRPRSYAAALFAAFLVLAACGGGADTTDANATTTGAAQEGDGPQGSTTTAPSADPGDESVEESSARVVIDGTTYEFGANGPAATCNSDFFGGFFAVLYTSDLTGVFQVELWEEGTGEGRTNTAGLNGLVGGVEVDLKADPEGTWPAVEQGTSFVESFDYEGNHAEGTISFIDTEVAYNGDLFPLDPVSATFEVTCTDE